jgi:hypothetical protein
MLGRGLECVCVGRGGGEVAGGSALSVQRQRRQTRPVAQRAASACATRGDPIGLVHRRAGVRTALSCRAHRHGCSTGPSCGRRRDGRRSLGRCCRQRHPCRSTAEPKQEAKERRRRCWLCRRCGRRTTGQRAVVTGPPATDRRWRHVHRRAAIGRHVSGIHRRGKIARHAHTPTHTPSRTCHKRRLCPICHPHFGTHDLNMRDAERLGSSRGSQ